MQKHAERLEILNSFREICENEGIELVIIHPSYRYSKPHECVLTDFCKSNQVPMFEAYESLHPQIENAQLLFYDDVHPNREGHWQLASDLVRFLGCCLK